MRASSNTPLRPQRWDSWSTYEGMVVAHSQLYHGHWPHQRNTVYVVCYGGSNILRTSEYTRPVRLGVWRIWLGRQDNKEER